MLYMTDMWEFQIRERMFFGKFFFCVCFLVSWKDVTLWFSTHTHTCCCKTKTTSYAKSGKFPASKWISCYAKIQGAIYCWACPTLWWWSHILGAMLLCGSLFFIEAAAFPEHGHQWWVEESFWGANRNREKTHSWGMGSDHCRVNVVCWPICHSLLSFQNILGWSYYNVGWSYHNGPPQPL